MTPYSKYKKSDVEWLGEIPKQWEVKKLKYISETISKGTTPSTEGKAILPFGDIIFLKAENIVNNDVVKFPENYIDEETNEALKRSQLAENDILIVIAGATIGKVAILQKESLPANTNQAVCFIRLNVNENYKFIWYYLQTHFIKQMISLDSVQSAQPNLSMEKIGNFITPYPSVLEQSQIAHYLDRKTAIIDRLIAQKRGLIALLQEEKAAMIQNAVTKGIDTEGVVFKDSGVEWLGEIPRHWKITNLRYIVTKIGSGVTPSGGASVYKLEGIPLLRSQNIHFEGLKLADVAYVTEEIDESMSNSRVESGDVLLNITGASIGRCFYIDDNFGRGNVNQHVCIIRPIEQLVKTKFLYYVLRSNLGQSQIDICQTGSNREGLNFEQIKTFVLGLPSIEEQVAIVHHIEGQSLKLNGTIERIEQEVRLLKEYRVALISEAVTGKIDVRNT